jgi:acyl-CoA reductase-like NAD-dependent aldehyde dehydrogenase
VTDYALIINGRRVVTQASFPVLNPADETVVGYAPQADIDHLDQAVAAARAAFPGWASQPDARRAAKLLQMADLIEAHTEEFADLLTLEQGKPKSGMGSRFEVGGAVAWTRATAALHLEDEIIQDDAAGKIVATRRPLGVVASITPWNWPLTIAIWHIMPAIRVGCTVVIKPSPHTPLATLKLVELLNTILPPGVLNVVTGDAEVGDRISDHPGIDKIVFTGSTPIGKRIMARASGSLKRLTLELGGNDAGIILPGTEIAPLLERLFWGAFLNAGQICSGLKRIFVHASQYEDVVAQFAAYAASVPMGNGMDDRVLVGPLNNAMQRDKVAHYVDDARASGARVVLGGQRPDGPGFFYPITVVADVTDDMLLVCEEQFGTAVPIIKYETVDEAIARANALDLGLGGSVWGNDEAEAAAVVRRLECGTAWVNQHSNLSPMAPFGGVKHSGIGTEFTAEGLKEYTYIQVLNILR